MDDHVGEFLGDIHGGIDTDPYVRRVQGGGIVDTVSHEAHRVIAGLQGLDDSLLVGGRDSCKQRRSLRRIRKP